MVLITADMLANVVFVNKTLLRLCYSKHDLSDLTRHGHPYQQHVKFVIHIVYCSDFSRCTLSG